MLKAVVSGFLVFYLGLSTSGQQREVRFCGQPEAWERLRSANPAISEDQRAAEEELERWTEEYANTRGGDQDIYIIPVVFHIIHNNGPENISDQQVLNALEILNRDFRKQNADISSVVSSFQGITADAGIEFRIARKDPNGNCTNGINRVVSDLTSQGNSAMKALIYWPRNRYLNVWICANAAGSAGYTQLPSNVNTQWAAPSDGIVIRHDYTGAIGTSNNTKSRTLTHEVGHWLNLLHTWGGSNDPALQSNCNIDDNVADTPNTVGWTSCNLNGSSCSTLDNVQNYMDYSYCSRMFTVGQATRMRAALNSGVAQRNQLITATTHNYTGILEMPLCQAQFTASETSTCTGTPIQFTDQSLYSVNFWTWNFGDGTIISGSDPLVFQNPVHTYTQPGTYTVTLGVANNSTSLEVTMQNLVDVFDAAMRVPPFEEGFEGSWPNSDWSVINADGGMTWEVTPAVAHTGVRSARVRNFNTTVPETVDALVSTTFDMTNAEAIFISYKWAYANKLVETNDLFRVSVSTNCGASWEMIRLRSGLTNLPTSNPTNVSFLPTSLSQWNGEVLVLEAPQYFTDQFRVKFELTARGGNNLYLDDINIWKNALPSVGIEELPGLTGITIYPNPAEQDMMLEFNTLAPSSAQIELIDLSGRVVNREYTGVLQPGEHRFRIPHQSAGMYVLRLVGNGEPFSRKVIFR